MDGVLDRLDGSNILITGAARRIGRMLAAGLARDGANVIIHYNRSGDQADDLAGQVRSMGVKAWTLQGDLSDAGQIDSLIDRAFELAGKVDILINNAAIFPAGTLNDASVEDFLDNIRINSLGPFALGRKFALTSEGGSIINFLDCRMVDYDPGHVPYTISKQVLYLLTRMMAMEFAPTFRVNGIAPGLILPPEGRDESYLQELAHTNPLCTHGTTGQIVSTVRFLLKTGFITGQVIYVDGGRHMKGSVYGF